MARIAGINIPNHQHAEIALTAIYGIGRSRAQAICAAAGVQGNRKIKDLNDGELERLKNRGWLTITTVSAPCAGTNHPSSGVPSSEGKVTSSKGSPCSAGVCRTGERGEELKLSAIADSRASR